MAWQHPTAQDHDHAQDHRKNWRPDEPAHRLDVPIPPAVEIALLVRNPTVSLTRAADLIESYANTKALEGQLEGTKQAYDRMDALLAKPVLP